MILRTLAVLALATFTAPAVAERCIFIDDGNERAVTCQTKTARFCREADRLTLVYDQDRNGRDRYHRKQNANVITNPLFPDLPPQVRVRAYSRLGEYLVDEVVQVNGPIVVDGITESWGGGYHGVFIEVFEVDADPLADDIVQGVMFEVDQPLRFGDEFGGFVVAAAECR